MHRFNFSPATAQLSWEESPLMHRGRQADYWQSWAENHIPIQIHCRGEYLQWICHPSPSTFWVIQNTVLITKPSFGGQGNFSFLSVAFPLHHCLLYSLLDTNEVYFFQAFQFIDNICYRAPQIPVITQLRERLSEGKWDGEKRRRGLGQIWSFFLKASFITAARDMLWNGSRVTKGMQYPVLLNYILKEQMAEGTQQTVGEKEIEMPLK